jgi:D-3-phosphoglycerate dehydrogenase
MISDFDVLIAGPEIISRKVLSQASNLKLISRVGIGLDSVDLSAAKDLGVLVSYTPDAPSPAVAEMTIGLMLTLLRSIQTSNIQMHQGSWHRYFGGLLSESTVGIIGVGRIGKIVVKYLESLNCKKIILNDIYPDANFDTGSSVEWAEKEYIYKNSDIISLHVPLLQSTKNLIQKEHIEMMKQNAVLINTSRGGVINEKDLYDMMELGRLSGAAIDVFEHEPYSGALRSIDRCILTAHMGSMSDSCRSKMEIEATEEVVRFSKGLPLQGIVPSEEYDNQIDDL